MVRRPSNSLIASIVVHVIVVGLFVQALWMKHPLLDLFGRRRSEPVGPVEHIGFLALPPEPNAKATPGRAGGNGRPARPTPVVPLVAPSQIPSTVPAPSNRAAVPDEDAGTGPLIGGGGPLRGIQPRYSDPRLWGGVTGPIATAPKSSAEQLDSVIKGDLRRYYDSVQVASGNRRDPTDWTFQKGGKKYGVDSKFIRLGPVSIPTSILALLPLNVSTSPSVTERERAYNAMHDDISLHAQQQINEADFQKAVRNIRERKDRERKEKEQEKQKASVDSAASGGAKTPAQESRP